MKYTEALDELKNKHAQDGYFVKYVPGLQEESGFLDPNAKKEIQMFQQENENINHQPTLQEIRDSMGWRATKDIAVLPLKIEERVTDSNVKVRIYQKKALKEKVPALIFIHGGGFFGGSLNNVENPCRALADKADIKVISVDYSLAPEKPYPNGLLDCYHAVKWVYENAAEISIDPRKIAIAGDSAGGNLSFTTSLLDRALGTNFIKAEVLIYPATVLRSDINGELWDLKKWGMKADKALISEYIMNFASSCDNVDKMYAPYIQRDIPFIAPLFASQLADMPSTLFLIGEFDPLRIQGEKLFNLMKEEGASVEYVRYNGMIHAFMDKIGDFPQAEDLINETVQFIMNTFTTV